MIAGTFKLDETTFDQIKLDNGFIFSSYGRRDKRKVAMREWVKNQDRNYIWKKNWCLRIK